MLSVRISKCEITFIFLVSISVSICVWHTINCAIRKINLYCETERYSKISLIFVTKKYLHMFDSIVLENSLFLLKHIIISLLCKTAHLHTNCLSCNLSLPRVSCKIHPIPILIEFLKFLMHTLISCYRKLSPE